MKLTLTIDDKHAPAIMSLLCGLVQSVEANADPTQDNPELPLMPFAEATDPTRRVLPMPEEFKGKLPPLPAGKTEWVYRGTFEGCEYETGDRIVRFWDDQKNRWYCTDEFSTELHHIEAILLSTPTTTT